MASATQSRKKKTTGKAKKAPAKKTAKKAARQAPAKKAPTKKATAKKAASRPAAKPGKTAPKANNGTSKKTQPNRATAKKSKTAAERSAPPMAEVDADVLEFIAAIDSFKKKHGRPFPSWSEVLLVVRELGYRR